MHWLLCLYNLQCSWSIWDTTEKIEGIIQLDSLEGTKLDHEMRASPNLKFSHLFSSMNSLYSLFIFTPDTVLHNQNRNSKWRPRTTNHINRIGPRFMQKTFIESTQDYNFTNSLSRNWKESFPKSKSINH